MARTTLSQTRVHRTHGARRPTLRLAAAGALTSLVLAGCQAGVVDDTETPEPVPGDSAPTTEEPTPEDAATTEEPTTEDPTTEEPTTDGTAVTDQPTDSDGSTAGPAGGDAAPGEIPPPGAEFEVGDTITTHVQAGQEGDQYYGYATLATTVTSVEPGDPSLFEQAENAADFAGLTPWFVTVETEWLTYEGEPNANMLPSVIAFNKSGGDVSPVLNSTWSAGIPGCELEMPDEKGVGEVASQCRVFAVPDGEAIGAVGWTGDDTADAGEDGRNPYWDEPVLWLVP